jgi:hypothetical protein
MECESISSRPCLTNVTRNFDLIKVDKFFKFLDRKLSFEQIVPTTVKIDVSSEAQEKVIGYFNDFNKNVSAFAKKVCDYITPNHSYENVDIMKQNQSYVRFQVANSFHFIKKDNVSTGEIQQADNLFFSDNLEDVFQQLNISITGINDEWKATMEMNRRIEDFNHLRQTEAVFINGFQNNLRGIPAKEFILANDVRNQQLRDIYNRIEDYKNYESVTSKQKVIEKFEDITANLIRSIVLSHVDNFSQSLNKLDTWTDENLRDSHQNTNFSVFFINLNKKVDKYFSYIQTPILLIRGFCCTVEMCLKTGKKDYSDLEGQTNIG